MWALLWIRVGRHLRKYEMWIAGGLVERRGTQSVATAVLILTGRLPKPDVGVIVDTGRETSTKIRNVDCGRFGRTAWNPVRCDGCANTHGTAPKTRCGRYCGYG